MSAWKQFERDCAKFFNARRYPANTGGRVDFASDSVVGQAKLVQTMSLETLSQWAEEIAGLAGPERIGVVCVKVRRGRGRASQPLVVLTFPQAKRAGLPEWKY